MPHSDREITETYTSFCINWYLFGVDLFSRATRGVPADFALARA